MTRHFLGLALPALLASPATSSAAGVPRFPLPATGLALERPARAGRFFDVVGRRSAVFGYENRPLEAWVWPLKLVDDFQLAFRLKDYPLEIEAASILASISVRPEATVFTYAHAAFTVQQIVFAPVDEPGIVMLLDVRTTLPMTVTGAFRPRLRPMWPAGSMTPNLGWDEKARRYWITEESGKFAGVLGSPGARDVSVMPYQEERRDLPIRFQIEVTPEDAARAFVPIVLAGSVTGRDAAKDAYDRLLATAPALYERNVAHYKKLLGETLSVTTPDPRLDESFAWAKVGVDKGLATNPMLGTGLLAGFRSSGDSERPGFAWFFGRDALWTALALDSYGDFASARSALAFLRKYQRKDGKVPHEISQSAALLPWFTDYPYPWNSADATPLYVIAQADLFRATGDRAFLDESWDSIVRGWRFTAATDTDGNGLVENTKFGHGWVEGGALYPPHEEIYQQGVWMEACRGLSALAEAKSEAALAAEARAAAERTRAAVEKTYWLGDRSFYGYATQLRRETPAEAEPGPQRERRQKRLDALASARFVDEDTVLPAVPMWWGWLDSERAQSEVDRLGGGALATDWGQRLLSNQSELYDPLSYHYGSVWPLFTGWASMAAYRYGRPHVGYQALMANALLRSASALGYVTELLSGDFQSAFGRSSHHQVWSEAMVATPVVRGLLGLSVEDGGRTLRFAPQLPANWDRVSATRVPVAGGPVEVTLVRGAGRLSVTVARPSGGGSPLKIVLAPAFPLDARVHSVSAGPLQVTRLGDVQRAEATLELTAARTEVVFAYDEGTDVYVRHEPAAAGAESTGIRILRCRAEGRVLRLTLEGRGGRTYVLHLRTPRIPASAPGATVRRSGRDFEVEVRFEGEGFVRREIVIPLG
ncbi:MAG: amylo-alpha-1,6-glucosidase [Acidobacteria bacterium]|nr:MAG: amylo-alpha-1,6-glucosidase [Acidobacteriota bacterium]